MMKVTFLTIKNKFSCALLRSGTSLTHFQLGKSQDQCLHSSQQATNSLEAVKGVKA